MRKGSGAPVAQRFWAKVQATGDGCWLWQGPVSGSGYGNFKLRRGIRVSAHRMAWELTNGTIPRGMCVLHRCDVKLCMNPEHLWLGTKGDNNVDRAAKGRSRNQDGEANFSAKLTTTQVTALRRLYRIYGVAQSALADQFGISQAQVSRIVTKTHWAPKEDM